MTFFKTLFSVFLILHLLISFFNVCVLLVGLLASSFPSARSPNSWRFLGHCLESFPGNSNPITLNILHLQMTPFCAPFSGMQLPTWYHLLSVFLVAHICPKLTCWSPIPKMCLWWINLYNFCSDALYL